MKEFINLISLAILLLLVGTSALLSDQVVFGLASSKKISESSGEAKKCFIILSWKIYMCFNKLFMMGSILKVNAARSLYLKMQMHIPQQLFCSFMALLLACYNRKCTS